MNASILDADTPFSHLLRSRFHIKLVIAYDPARHNSHSCGPCYMNEVWRNANIYAHTFEFWAFLIKNRAAAISNIKLYLGIHAQTLNPHNSRPCIVQPHHAVPTRNKLCTTALSSTTQSAAALLQLHLLGRSSVRQWTSLWPFGIPRSSAEREVSLKDTFLPLLRSNSIVLTG